MIPDNIKALSPWRKPCGCYKPTSGGPRHRVVEGKFDSEMKDHGTVRSRHKYLDMHCVCEECKGTYFLRWGWAGLNDPHPDWREWSKRETVVEENKMGEKHQKTVTIYHDDYERVFDWCPYSHIEKMWNGGSEPDYRKYGSWDGKVQMEDTDE